eukprot:gnl/TRDRNA2_/TRDRNA2_43598_c0_seq1.p1 gnl/TRDRNA2_/TRDRNA2_43598_c0~~gnl/TRDRNA2_/TRDRNA2_43598_c0_seq1.p1  ORF type:complete len:449 (+),score=87.32 gnl/TRDRNA2_/TRDRNA2_43598_c0_seq1:74-1420(+)
MFFCADTCCEESTDRKCEFRSPVTVSSRLRHHNPFLDEYGVYAGELQGASSVPGHSRYLDPWDRLALAQQSPRGWEHSGDALVSPRTSSTAGASAGTSMARPQTPAEWAHLLQDCSNAKLLHFISQRASHRAHLLDPTSFAEPFGGDAPEVCDTASDFAPVFDVQDADDHVRMDIVKELTKDFTVAQLKGQQEVATRAEDKRRQQRRESSIERARRHSTRPTTAATSASSTSMMCATSKALPVVCYASPRSKQLAAQRAREPETSEDDEEAFVAPRVISREQREHLPAFRGAAPAQMLPRLQPLRESTVLPSQNPEDTDAPAPEELPAPSPSAEPAHKDKSEDSSAPPMGRECTGSHVDVPSPEDEHPAAEVPISCSPVGATSKLLAEEQQEYVSESPCGDEKKLLAREQDVSRACTSPARPSTDMDFSADSASVPNEGPSEYRVGYL